MPTLAIVVERQLVKVLDLDEPVIRIGRDPEMDIVLDDLSVSRRQAELYHEGRSWKIRDLHSSNGTFLNGERISAVHALTAGDEISFGRFSVFFDHVPATSGGVEPSPPTGRSPGGRTRVLSGDDAATLRHLVLEKRQAQLRWDVEGHQGTHYVKAGGVLVGRTDLCDLRMPGRGPNQHLLFICTGHLVEARNLSRSYGMRINGTPTRHATLRDGDRIEIGAFRLTFLDQVG
jgi:pSer/pThr/pTyr-binding forkhead associated (FHA) protein